MLVSLAYVSCGHTASVRGKELVRCVHTPSVCVCGVCVRVRVSAGMGGGMRRPVPYMGKKPPMPAIDDDGPSSSPKPGPSSTSAGAKKSAKLTLPLTCHLLSLTLVQVRRGGGWGGGRGWGRMWSGPDFIGKSIRTPKHFAALGCSLWPDCRLAGSFASIPFASPCWCVRLPGN